MTWNVSIDQNLHGLVPPVVVLWYVLRRWNHSGGWLGLAVLEACGVNRKALEHDIEEELGPLRGTSGPGLDLGKIQAMAFRANEEAASLGHNYVGTEHLVLALVNDEDAVVGKLFQKHAVNAERFKAKLVELLHG
jgi:ATP-dependent Clp protease ATP-binding subunit ClpC